MANNWKRLTIINQRNLVSYIENVIKVLGALDNHLHYLDFYIQIDFRLQIILDKLMILEDAITFSQLGVMHPSIISPQSLVLELRQLKTKFNLVPVIDIDLKNIRILESSIKVKAYSTEHSLTFILEIPSIDPNIYDLINLYSISDTKYFNIIPKPKYINGR